MKFKKDDEGKLVLDDKGDPIAVTEEGEVIPLDKVVSLGKFQRVESERDEHKLQAEKLTGQIEDLKKVSGDKEALEKRISELTEASAKDKADLETRMAERDKEHALDTALLGAGVPSARLKAAKALVDSESLKLDGEKLFGLDVETFKKDNAYLFDAAIVVDSAAAARGAGGSDANEAQMRSVMGLETKE